MQFICRRCAPMHADDSLNRRDAEIAEGYMQKSKPFILLTSAF
jgi:hypothetical protein